MSKPFDALFAKPCQIKARGETLFKSKSPLIFTNQKTHDKIKVPTSVRLCNPLDLLINCPFFLRPQPDVTLTCNSESIPVLHVYVCLNLTEKVKEVYKNFLQESGIQFSELEEKVMQFHLSNLEYACGSTLDQVLLIPSVLILRAYAS